MKKKINKKEIIIEIPDDVKQAMQERFLLDAVVEVLKQKKLINEDEIKKQIIKSTKNMEEFVKRNPALIEDMAHEAMHKKEKASYIG